MVCKSGSELNCSEVTEERLRTVLRRDLGICENPTVGHVMKCPSTYPLGHYQKILPYSPVLSSRQKENLTSEKAADIER